MKTKSFIKVGLSITMQVCVKLDSVSGEEYPYVVKDKT